MENIQYIQPNDIASRLKGIVNIQPTSEESSQKVGYDSYSGGVSISLDEVNSYILQSQSYVWRKLSTLYKIPLTNLSGSTNIEEFSQMTRDNIKRLVLDHTCISIVSYAFAQQASISLRNYLESITERFEENMSLVLINNEVGGRMYPAFDDLVLSDMYLTRQQSLSIDVVPCANPARLMTDYVWKLL